MLISVVIPTFNRAHVLERAIDSVLGQTYQNIEVIVVDDASTDETLVVLEKYWEQVKIIHTRNNGVSAARNKGLKHCKGEWVAFLDSDDEWLPQRLEKQIEFIQSNPHVPLVHGEEIWIRRGKRVNPKFKHKKGGGDQFIPSLGLCLISPSASLIRKETLEKWKGFDEEFVVCEDYDLWLKITAEHEVGFIEEPIIVKHGGHEDQLSAKYHSMDYWRVWSMMRLLDLVSLTAEKERALLEEVRVKSRVLLQGYEKHQNLNDYEQVYNWCEVAGNQLEASY